MLLNNTTMAIPAAIYSLIMYFTAATFASFAARSNAGESFPEEPPKTAA
jgi:BASS family bile acid:Na+ symporter